jgi:hypothetical protein
MVADTISANDRWLNSEFKRVDENLGRLEANKADKGVVKGLSEKLDEFKRRVDGDVTGVQETVEGARQLAAAHPCKQEKVLEEHSEKQKDTAAKIEFWNKWFLRGLIGFIGFLVTVGGLWLWSYFQLSATATEAHSLAAATIEVTKEIQTEQEAQRAMLKRIESPDTTKEKTQLDAMRAMFEEVLQKQNKKGPR